MRHVQLGVFPEGTTADSPRGYGLYYSTGYMLNSVRMLAPWKLIGRKRLTTSQLGITSLSFYRLLRGIR